MKKMFFIISVVFSAILLHSCIENPEFTPGVIGADIPAFEGRVEHVGSTANSITVSATISKENGSKIEDRGFYIGTTSNPTEENGGQKVPDTSGSVGRGEYTMVLGDLGNNVEYYIMPYAKNASGESHGEPRMLRTNPGLVKRLISSPLDSPEAFIA